ncbi:hypothetical protein V6N13_036292 [Hibiscus sabdariffa]
MTSLLVFTNFIKTVESVAPHNHSSGCLVFRASAGPRYVLRYLAFHQASLLYSCVFAFDLTKDGQLRAAGTIASLSRLSFGL